MTSVCSPTIRFRGLEGRALAWLLQLRFVRYRRVQRGFVRDPDQYTAFLVEVVRPRLMSMPGRLGIFGVGSHTDVVMRALPDLRERIVCFTDNNSAAWHKQRFGKAVLPPAEAVTTCDTFFLSTVVFQHVLRADLQTLGFRGSVIAVDDELSPSWFLAL